MVLRPRSAAVTCRRVADLTEPELRELVAGAVEEGIRRSKRPGAQKAPPARPSPAMLERIARVHRRKGILAGRR